MDKYYEPDLEEFHQGFEYEYGTKLNQDFLWTKMSFGFDLLRLSPESPTLNKNIRVKYLSQEDIESLGFISSNVIDVLKEEDEFIKGFEKNTYILYIQEDKKLVIYNQKEYDISNKITGNWTEEILFKGYIKNKSELKFILKCLKI